LSIGMLAGQMEQIFADGFAAAYETLSRQ
jgi:hypothetical protein